MVPETGRSLRAQSVRRWLLGAVLVAACVDGPTDPGRFGELRIRPTYPEGDAPTALGLGIDSAHVRATRQGESTPAIDTVVAYSSDTASLGWVLSLQAEEETLAVDLVIWDDGVRVYSGERSVTVRQDDIAAEGAEPVLVAYVGPPIVATVDIGVESATLDALGATVTLSAVARDRRDQVVTTTYVWSSADAGVATVDEASGAVTAVSNGSTFVRVTAGAAVDSAAIVVAQRVATIAISPENPVLTALGAQLGLSASVWDPNGQPVAGATVTWSSSDAAVASVDAATGMVTAARGGSATITAAAGDVTGSTVVNVNPVANVASVTVSPTSAILDRVGATRQFSAIARDDNGDVLEGVQFTWTSASSAIANVDAATGLATAAGQGSTAITAAAGDVTGSATLTVDLTESITSIEVSPVSVTLNAAGATQQFSAVARDAANDVLPGVVFTWTSTNTGVATVDPATGLATAVAHGATTITAAAGGESGAAQLSVDLASTVTRVVVSPASATLTALGATRQFTAQAFDATDMLVPGMTFLWTSSDPGVATVGESGLTTATGHGTSTISAAVNDVTGTATLAVDLTEVPMTIAVTPAAATVIAIGATQQFTAVARDASGTILPNVPFSWSSSAPGVATVDPASGLAASVSHGTATITASVGDQSGAATLTVDLTPTVARIVVTPATATLDAFGASQQFTAAAFDANDAVVPGIVFTWTSATGAVADIDPATGLATAAGQGSTTITAAAGDIAGTATLIVDFTSAIASIEVSPSAATLTAIGATQQFSAVARDAAGNVLPGVSFTWSSSADGVATVDATGLATAMANGTATVSARVGSISGSASVIVHQ